MNEEQLLVLKGLMTSHKEEQELQVKNLNTAIDEKIARFNQSVSELSTGKEELETKFGDLSSEVKGLVESVLEKQAHLDKLDIKLKGLTPSAAAKKTFRGLIRKEITGERAKKNFDEMLAGNRKSFSLEFEVDEIARKSMTVGTNFIGDVIAPDYLNRVEFPVSRPWHMRDIIAIGETDSDTLSYPKETARTGAPAMHVEGELKAETETTLTEQRSPVEELATFVQLSNRMLDDASFIVSYLSLRLTDLIMREEDSQILFGSGVSPNINGIATQAVGFDAGIAAGALTDPLRRNVLIQAVAQLATEVSAGQSSYNANYIILNPQDYAGFFHEMAAIESSSALDRVVAGNLPTIMGVPILWNNAMTVGDFLVGDFTKCQLFDRKTIRMQFFDQDGDNVRRNMTTVRVEERFALNVYHDDAFVFDDFATAITALTLVPAP